MKRILYSFLIISFLSLLTFKIQVKADAPAVGGDGAIVMDATTGQILYSKNPDTKYPPASTTKIMTALLVLENCNLNETVKVSDIPPYAIGSKIGLFPGEEMSVWDLLHGLLIESGNDCADALAEHVSGSIDNFTKLMNKRALELGCKNTNFVNPHGLYDPLHRTSAYDLALMLRELSKYPQFHIISTSIGYKIPATNKAPERGLWNKDYLLIKGNKLYFNGIIGAKTGYTIDSKFSYVASATRNGETLILAIMHNEKDNCFKDAYNLLNYCFDNFTLKKIYSKGDPITTYKNNKLEVPLISEKDIYGVFNKNDIYTPPFTLKDVNLNNTSFKKGDYVISGSLSFKDNYNCEVPLCSTKNHIIIPPKKALDTDNFDITKLTFLTLLNLIIASVFYVIKKYKKGVIF